MMSGFCASDHQKYDNAVPVEDVEFNLPQLSFSHEAELHIYCFLHALIFEHDFIFVPHYFYVIVRMEARRTLGFPFLYVFMLEY